MIRLIVTIIENRELTNRNEIKNSPSHLIIIANMPPVNIPVLAVCRMFVTWT